MRQKIFDLVAKKKGSKGKRHFSLCRFKGESRGGIRNPPLVAFLCGSTAFLSSIRKEMGVEYVVMEGLHPQNLTIFAKLGNINMPFPKGRRCHNGRRLAPPTQEGTSAPSKRGGDVYDYILRAVPVLSGNNRHHKLDFSGKKEVTAGTLRKFGDYFND